MKFLPIVSRLLIVTLFVSTAPAWVVAETCHPHLFQRTNQTKTELDSVFGSRLAWFSKLIAANPKLGPGSSKTWQSITNGVVRKLTLTLASDGQTYSFELDLAAASPTLVFVKVWTGSASFTASTPTLVTNATLSVDYDALKSVDATSPQSGQVTAVMKIVNDPTKPAPGIQNTSNVSFTNFSANAGDSAGAATGNYVEVGEPGIGGAFVFADSLTLLCPSNPNKQISQSQVVERFYFASDGSLHGRWDARADAGPIPAGDAWILLHCNTQNAASNLTYDLFKLEDSSGNTVTGGVGGAGVCDPVLGPVPSLVNNSTDYNFNQAVTFPGEW